MLKQKNALIAIAVATLLAACGGGGGDSSQPPADTSGQNQNQNPPPSDNNNNNPPPVDQTVADTEVTSGQLSLYQVVSNDAAVPLEDFEAKTAGTYGLYAQPQGASGSPLKNFGIKFLTDQSLETGTATGNGHIAIEFMDVATNSPQQFQVVIDRVDYSLSKAAPKFTATVPATAKAYLHVQSSTGGVADVVLDNLPEGVVTVPAAYTDDPEFRGLVVDLDKLLAAAKTKAATDSAKTAALDSVKDFKGEFKLNATYSAIKIVRAGQTDGYPGADITVAGSNLPAIKGNGVQGVLWVGMNPPTVP